MSPAATMALRPGPSKRDSLSPPQTSSLISPAALPPTLNPYEASLHARFDGAGARYDPGPFGAQSGPKSPRSSLASTRSSVSWTSADTPTTRRTSTLSAPQEISNGTSNNITRGPRPAPGSRRSSLGVSSRHSRQSNGYSRAIDRLTPEVLDCVIDQLRGMHSDPHMASCASCYLRDLHSMCMANKTWRRAARPRMYCAIWIVGNDSIAQTRKKFKTRYGARLRLLRRTLRENPILAGFVRELKGPAIPDARSFGGAERQHYLDTVASVVMACPNLERLTGFYVSYDHTFDRLSHALSTRTRLKEHVWVVAGNDSMRQLPSNYLDPGFLQPEEMDMFLHLHDQWGRLETLFLHSHSDGVLEHELFVGVFSRLPSLRHLCVSGFHVHDFGDVTLQALPPLQSLRLQNLRGVTDRGVLRYASTPAAQDLERLSLINLELTSLPVLSKVFACLRYLKRFTLIQRRPPELEPSGLILQPIIGSSSLEWLHWDVADPGEANNLLSASIEANGFPNLRAIRAPSDDEGSLQSVCRPLEQATITTDKYNFPQRYANSGHRASVYAKTLFAARKSAQERIELARARFKFHIVIEEEGVVKQVFKIPDFIGSLESQITYSLKPDIHGSDRAVIDLPDLLDGSKELEARDGCTGVWNSDHPSGKKWWSHTERFRYRKVDLERFF